MPFARHHGLHASRTLASVSVIALALTSIAACSESPKLPAPPKAFCDAAKVYEEAITTKNVPVADQIPMVAKIEASAPADVKADAKTFLGALRAFDDGDESVIDDGAVKAAADRVNRRYSVGCGVFKRKNPV